MSKVKSFGIIGFLLAALFALSMFAAASPAYADDIKATVRVNVPYDGMELFTLDGQPAYCAERRMGTNVDVVPSYQLIGTDATSYESDSQGTEESKWWRDGNPWEQIRKILYLGYPTNGGDLQGDLTDDQFQAATQEAVWYWTNSLPLTDGDSAVKAVAQQILDSTVTPPADFGVEFYSPTGVDGDNKPYNDQVQSLFRAGSSTPTPTPSTPEITNTTAKVNDTAGSVELATGSEGTFTDEVEFSGLEDGKTYTIVSYLYKDKGDQPFDTFETADITKDSSPVTVTFKRKITEAGTYSVKTELKLDGDVVADHNGNLGIDAETVTVSFNDSPEPTPGSPKIGTTLKVGNTSAAGSLLSLDAPAYAWVVDSIAYEGMTDGVMYVAKGELWAFKGGDTEGSKVAEAEGDFEAIGTSGTWDLFFGHVSLEEATYYVVYEYLYDKDGNEVARHAEATDFAQAVVVQPADDISIIPPDTPFAPAFGLTMSTTVDINGKAASANSPRTVDASDVSKVKKVNDTITYSGFGPGETYTVTGKLMDVTNASSPKEVKQATAYLTASDSGSGTWTMTFDGVTLEVGHKYVVFESAADASDTVVATHEDVNDKAQTIVVTAPATPAKQTAKTADAASGAVLGALFVALAAAGIAMGARRKFER